MCSHPSFLQREGARGEGAMGRLPNSITLRGALCSAGVAVGQVGAHRVALTPPPFLCPAFVCPLSLFQGKSSFLGLPLSPCHPPAALSLALGEGRAVWHPALVLPQTNGSGFFPPEPGLCQGLVLLSWDGPDSWEGRRYWN